MINFIQLTDIHWCMSNSYRVDNVMDTLDSKFDQVKQYIKEYDVKAVLISGDLFDQKHGTKIPYTLTSRAIRQIRSLKIPVYAIPGNHDMNLNSIENHPLKLMFDAGILLRASKEPVEILNTEVYLCGFDHKYQKDLKQFDIKFEIDKPLIGLIHLVMNKEPGMYYSEPQYGIEEIGINSPVDLFTCGHIHVSLPEMRNTRGQLYVQPGAFRRTNTASEEISRIPQITLISVDPTKSKRHSISTKYLPIHCRIDIFKDWKREIKSEKKEELQGFLDRVQSMRTSNRMDTATLIREANLEPEVREVLESYLSESGN